MQAWLLAQTSFCFDGASDYASWGFSSRRPCYPRRSRCLHCQPSSGRLDFLGFSFRPSEIAGAMAEGVYSVLYRSPIAPTGGRRQMGAIPPVVVFQNRGVDSIEVDDVWTVMRSGNSTIEQSLADRCGICLT